MSLRQACGLLVAALTLGFTGAAEASRVLVMSPDGKVRATRDPLVPRAPASERSLRAPQPRASTRAASTNTPARLRFLLRTGQIDQATHDRALAAYKRNRYLIAKLSGARESALKGVRRVVNGMAARDQITAGRLPALVATLERNNEWWATGPLLSSGARVSFTGSGLVWQHYPGYGIQIQWLGTWGKANGLFGEDEDVAFEDLVAESVSLAAPRAGGIAWEYLFPFGGGNPPWVSGLAQGTALTALVRAGQRFHDQTWYDAARRGLGIFKTPAPEGVSQPTAHGTHFLQYSYDTRLHILNGFIQSLNGLFDYAKLTGDQEGWDLFAAGRERAEWELPRYDTGGWSKYSEYRDSDLHYHDVLRGFMARLCTRLQKAKMKEDPFCFYASRFTLDLQEKPEVTFGKQGRIRAKRPARFRFSIDKPATVTLVISRGSFTHRAVVAVSSGPHDFGWRPPSAGTYAVTLTARDLAGNTDTFTTQTGVRRRR